MKKKLIIAVISVICIFAIFVMEECIRLKVDDNSKPLIVLHIDRKYFDNDENGTDVTYYSLGFKTEMKYYLYYNSSEDARMFRLVGKEFYLFNAIMLWEWSA